MIPKQVIEETKAAKQKEKHLGRPKKEIEHLYTIIAKCNNLQIPKQFEKEFRKAAEL